MPPRVSVRACHVWAALAQNVARMKLHPRALQLCSGSWGELDKILASTSSGNGGHIGLFVDMPEITPQIATTGRFRRGPEGEVNGRRA